MVKKISTVLLVFMLTFTLCVPFANIASANDDVKKGTITDRVNAAKGEDSLSVLETKAEEAGGNFLSFLRTGAIILSVIMFVVVGYALLFSPNVKTIADCKGRVGALILAIVIAVMAEEIVGTLMSWVE